MMVEFKETTLEGHIQLCELRYKNLEEKINAVEARLTRWRLRSLLLKVKWLRGSTRLSYSLKNKAMRGLSK